MSDLALRADVLSANVRRELASPAAMLLPASVRALLIEQAAVIAAIAQQLQHGTPPADFGGISELEC